MAKIVLSAMIRQTMPTRPFDGSDQSAFSGARVAVAVLMGLLVLPVGVGGMFEVPEWTGAFDDRRFGKVVFRWRRPGRPFERPCIPGVVARRFSFGQRPDNVPNEDQKRGRLKRHTHRADQVQRVPTSPGFVGVYAAWHSEHARNVHRVERDVESDDEEPEMPFAESLAEDSACGLRKPVIDGAKNRE